MRSGNSWLKRGPVAGSSERGTECCEHHGGRLCRE